MTNLRNTYHVPAGREVVVNSAGGEKKYTGGQFVPPEELAHSQERAASGGSDKGNEGNSEVAAWQEIFEEFKKVDPYDSSALNKASFSINDYVEIPIKPSSRNVNVSTFAADLSIANLIQNIPGIKEFLKEIPCVIYINDPKNAPQKTIDNFKQITGINFDKANISYWQNGKNIDEVFKNGVYSVSFSFGFFIINSLKLNTDEQTKQLPQLQNQIKDAKNMLNNRTSTYIKEHKGRQPKPGSNAEIDELQQSLESSGNLLSQITAIKEELGNLKDSTEQERGLDSHIDSHLEVNDYMGVYEQFAQAIAQANMYSMGKGKTFNDGLEYVSKTHPETMKSIKKLLTMI